NTALVSIAPITRREKLPRRMWTIRSVSSTIFTALMDSLTNSEGSLSRQAAQSRIPIHGRTPAVYDPAKISRIAALLAAPLLCAMPGCAGHKNAWRFYQPPPAPTPLGTHVDQFNRIQEENAEAAKFIVYQHEFKLNELVDGQNVGGY